MTPKQLSTKQMVYGEEELGAAANAARKNAAYFRDLDWENTLGKWGHFANPWKDHYPGCWKDLAKVREKDSPPPLLRLCLDGRHATILC